MCIPMVRQLNDQPVPLVRNELGVTESEVEFRLYRCSECFKFCNCTLNGGNVSGIEL